MPWLIVLKQLIDRFCLPGIIYKGTRGLQDLSVVVRGWLARKGFCQVSTWHVPGEPTLEDPAHTMHSIGCSTLCRQHSSLYARSAFAQSFRLATRAAHRRLALPSWLSFRVAHDEAQVDESKTNWVQKSTVQNFKLCTHYYVGRRQMDLEQTG